MTVADISAADLSDSMTALDEEIEDVSSSEEALPRRSFPPPPPSRRPSPPSVSGVRNALPSASQRPLPPPPGSVPSAPPCPASASMRPTLPSATQSSPPSSSVHPVASARDPISALYRREKERLQADHAAQVEQMKEEHDRALAALRRELAQAEKDRDEAVERAAARHKREQEEKIKAARRRMTMAAHVALEDRQGLVSHLISENDQLRARVHILEEKLDLDKTQFAPRPRIPFLPPELFEKASGLPPPLPSSAPRRLSAEESEPLTQTTPLTEEEPDTSTATSARERTWPKNEPITLSEPPREVDTGLAAKLESKHDDLTELRGVGKAIARSLRELGVTRFEQIAAWNEEDIKMIAPRLRRRPNRIRKDGWIKSAQDLLAQRGGT